MQPLAAPFVSFGITVLSALVAALVAAVLAKASTARLRWLAPVLIAAWMAGTYAAAASGALARFDERPPALVIVLAVMVILTLGLGLSKLGGRLAHGLPLAALIGFQGFRLPLELLMNQAAREGVMPVQMSFMGWNFDILTGTSAIVVAWLASRGKLPRWGAVVWNALGSILLLTIVAIAVASTPLFAAFGTSPAELNTWIASPPYVWLPAVLVAGALFGHVLVWRRLLSSRRPPG